MSALLNNAPLNGGHLLVWAEGHSTVEGISSAVLRRAAYTASTDHLVEASTTAWADRTAWPFAVTDIGEATGNSDSKRFAYFDGVAVSSAAVEGSADRTAWMASTVSAGESIDIATPVRWRLLTGSAKGVATSTDDEALIAVYRTTRVRDTRGIAHTVIGEKAISRILVNQVAFSGTCIGRSRSDGLANTEIGFGICKALSVNTDENLLVNVHRSMKGTCTAECAAIVAPHQIHVGNSIPAADAHTYIAPDILRADGSNERYAWAKPVAQTVFSQLDILAIRIVAPDMPSGVGSSFSVDAFFTRSVEGISTGLSDIGLRFGDGRINRWHWHTGKSVSEATGNAIGDRLAWVEAFGASDAMAMSSSDSTRYRWKWTSPTETTGEVLTDAENTITRTASGLTTGLITSQGIPFKIGGGRAESKAEAGLSTETITYHWEWVTAESVAEGISVKADFLYPVRAVPVKPIYGEASIEKVYFYLNAAELAPDSRTVFVPMTVRSFAVPYYNREVFIQ